MKRVLRIFLVVVAFASAAVCQYTVLQDEIYYIDGKSSRMVCFGETYSAMKNPVWEAVEVDQRLGAPADWGNDIVLKHLGLWMTAGVFKIKGNDDLSALYVIYPDSEYERLYYREDKQPPALDEDQIDRVAFVNDRYHMAWEESGKSTDAQHIKELFEILSGEESTALEGSYPLSGDLLLYSKDFPGIVYPLAVAHLDGKYWISYDDYNVNRERTFSISKELLDHFR